MPSIFTPILNGEKKAAILLQNEEFLACLEPSPLKTGHTLVILKKELDAFFTLEDEVMVRMMLFAKKVAASIQKTVPCQKIALIAYGIQVRHAHLHLIPIDGTPGEMDLSRPRKEADLKKLNELALKIQSFI